MEINPTALQNLLDSVCGPVRQSVRQSEDAIIRNARQRLSKNAFDVPALHVVAASSLAKEQPERSLDLLDHHPDGIDRDPLSNRLAGYAWLIKQDMAKAKTFFDHAVRLDPNQPDCWNWLGKIAEHGQDYEQAVVYYQRGIVFDDGEHESVLALSRMHARHRQLTDAIHTLRVCLIRDRRSATLNLALARLLDRRAFLLGRRRRSVAQQRVRQEALACYRIVNAAAPTSQSFVMQGRLEQQLLDHEAAKRSFQKAVQLDPTSAGAASQLAAVHVDFGDIDTALVQFENALALDPGRAETHFRYTRAKRFQPGTASRRYTRQVTQLLAEAESAQQRQKQVYLHFALAKVLDDIGRFDQAWRHYDCANRLKIAPRRSVTPDQSESDPPPCAVRVLADDSTRCLSGDFFRRVRGLGNPSRMPIFVVGMPRSGTTLTEQILSSHPQIAGAGELTTINSIRQELSRSHVKRLRGSNPFHRPSDAWASYSEILAEAEPAELRCHADEYLQQLGCFADGARHVTDKMPTNFMHLGLIATLFPGATVIHCRRNPMDVLVSCYCQNLNAPFCDLEMLVDYHRQYRRLMRHWERVLPIAVYTNDYESLVSDPQRGARAMIEHCGLEWDETCLNFHANERAIRTPSKWQVRQPMYRSSVEKWRRFETQLAPIAESIFAELRAEADGDTHAGSCDTAAAAG